MKTFDYINLVQAMIDGTISLDAVIDLMEADRALAQVELSRSARMVGYTYGDENARLPIYFFNGYDCPNAAFLMNISKIYSFAQIGSAYSSYEMSTHDIRPVNPYTQVGVYDPNRKLFVAGLRFLPLYKGISYEESSMSGLFIANKSLLRYLPRTLELGTTFIIPDVQGSIAATHYLLSAMSFAIIDNKPEYLVGRPTIPGVFNNDLKELISSWLMQEFPLKNSFLNPDGKNFLDYHTGVPPIPLRPFSHFVNEYGVDYKPEFTMRQKILTVNRMVASMGMKFPHIISFYAAITESPNVGSISPGMMALGLPVENHIYMSKSWEIGILVVTQKIASAYIKYLDYAAKTLGL